MTDLDKIIQEIATKNYPQFVALVGEEAIRKAKICLLRQNEYSYNAIAVKLGVSREQARRPCGSCDIEKV